MCYYEVIPSTDIVDHKIKWNVFNIAKEKSATGYILQHIRITSNISTTKSDDYWEAWSVKNGQVEDSGFSYDDNWSPLPSFCVAECEEEILNSLDGVIQYESDVFWIPHTSYIYDEIHTWKPVVGSSAGELPTVKEIQYDLQDFYVCSRHYQWNYKLLLQTILKNRN